LDAVEARRPAQGCAEHRDVAARSGVRLVRSAAQGAGGHGPHAKRLLDGGALLGRQFVDVESGQRRLRGAHVIDGFLEASGNLHLRREVSLDQPEGVARRGHVLLLPRAWRFDFGIRRLEIRGQVVASLGHGRRPTNAYSANRSRISRLISSYKNLELRLDVGQECKSDLF
jgi:hypothetical protein